jgi:hypothetical protein
VLKPSFHNITNINIPEKEPIKKYIKFAHIKYVIHNKKNNPSRKYAQP